MAIHGKATGVLLGGYDLGPMLNNISTPQSVDTAETTAFGAVGKTYVAGQSDATVSMSGMYEGAWLATEQMLDVAASTSDAILVSYGRALAVGQDCKFGAVLRSAFEVSSPVGDIVSITGAAQADGGLNTGPCLAAKSVITTSPTNGATVDGTAATTNGGFAALFVTANTRNGTVTAKVQHSVDGSTWVDKATFVVVSATQLASQVIPLAGTINRYTRVVVTLAGSTGSATVTVALSRG